MRPVQIYALVARLAQWEAASFALETSDFIVSATRQGGAMRLRFDGAVGGRVTATVYPDRATLNQNLAAEPNAIALVIAAGADLGIYTKIGGIGSGNWAKTAVPVGSGLRTILQALLDGLNAGGGSGSTDLTPVYQSISAAARTQTTVERNGAPDDLSPGQHRIEWNTARGAPSLWMNRGGTIIDFLNPDNSGWTTP